MIHRDANGRIVFQEWDWYEIARYIGATIGKQLQGLERRIRTDFRLEEI
jgi:hypothetical protein